MQGKRRSIFCLSVSSAEGLACVIWIQKYSDVNTKSHSQPFHVVYGNVPFSALDRTDISSMQITKISKPLLRDALAGANLPQVARKSESGCHAHGTWMKFSMISA